MCKMEMEAGVHRWAFNTSLWHPSPEEFTFCLSVLPPSQQPDVTRFVMMQDQKRALVSRLLQLKVVHSVLGIPYEEIVIQRTKEGKPYLANEVAQPPFPNFNFNTSHHGDYVVLASEPLCAVGVDVMTHDPNRTEPPWEYLEAFKACFTGYEWERILRARPDCGPVMDQFLRFWCMKEAYIKALGIGLGFQLQKAEFRYQDDDLWANMARVWINGTEQHDWRFWLHNLGDKHWACVARGPPWESLGTRLTALHFEHDMYAKALCLPEKHFHTVCLQEILPSHSFYQFQQLGLSYRATKTVGGE